MSDWKDLEEKIKTILTLDKATRTPLSGGTKHEEDVVGVGTICQCKHSDNKNITILTKDIDRLLSAAKLLNKFPLFCSKAGDHTLISLPLKDEYEDDIIHIINILILLSKTNIISSYINMITDKKKTLEFLKLINEINTQLTLINNTFYSKIEDIKNSINAKIDDIEMHNLFGD